MRTPIRVAFLGNAPWSVPALASLVEASARIEVTLVLTREPRPGRRGADPSPTPVAELAVARGLPLVQTPTVRSGRGFEALRAAGVDAIVVVAYGELLPPDVLGLAPLGALNVHFSLLPRWRGAAPVQRAILAGDPTTGVTTMVMDEGLDTGPVVERREEPVRHDDDAGALGARLAALGGPLTVSSLEGLAAGTLVPAPQVGAPTLAPKLTAADRPIPWADDAEAIVRRVRALSPAPGATAVVDGAVVKVIRAEPAATSGDGPAVVVAVEPDALVVGAGTGAVRVMEVAPPGRRRMSGGDLARGARLAPGDRLG